MKNFEKKWKKLKKMKKVESIWNCLKKVETHMKPFEKLWKRIKWKKLKKVEKIISNVKEKFILQNVTSNNFKIFGFYSRIKSFFTKTHT